MSKMQIDLRQSTFNFQKQNLVRKHDCVKMRNKSKSSENVTHESAQWELFLWCSPPRIHSWTFFFLVSRMIYGKYWTDGCVNEGECCIFKKMWQWALKHRHALIIIYIAFHIGYSIWIRNHKYTISLHIFGPHRRGRQWKTENWVCRESSPKIRKFIDTQTQYKHTISTEK